MEYKSVFSIIGPIMVGPSSSHTAGALEIAKYGRKLFKKQPKKVVITLYNSFAKTYKGHGTDVALVGGLLDFETDDLRIPNAFKYADETEMEIEFKLEENIALHPNTVKLHLSDAKKNIEVIGVSIGGGSFKIIKE